MNYQPVSRSIPTIVYLQSILSHEDVDKSIQNLNPKKAYSHDKISIRMLKECGFNINKPLEIIFKEALSTALFQSQ